MPTAILVGVRLLLSLVIFGAMVSSPSSNGVNAVASKLDVVYAVNAGGNKFTDSYGITYQKDPLTTGIASDFGMQLNIDRVYLEDAILYQTERYSTSNFGYDIPITEDGSYVLVLKFSEVYFRNKGQKIFDVLLNSVHLIVQDLDIFSNVGYATAHDEVIPFKVSGGGKKLHVGDHVSDIKKGKMRVEFMKGFADNPKVNAFYVVKGTIEDVPLLPPPQGLPDQGEEEEMEDDDGYLYGDDEEDIHFSKSDLGNEAQTRVPFNLGSGAKRKIRSGAPADDPWEREPVTVVYMPMVGSLGASVVAFFIVRFVHQKL